MREFPSESFSLRSKAFRVFFDRGDTTSCFDRSLAHRRGCLFFTPSFPSARSNRCTSCLYMKMKALIVPSLSCALFRGFRWGFTFYHLAVFVVQPPPLLACSSSRRMYPALLSWLGATGGEMYTVAYPVCLFLAVTAPHRVEAVWMWNIIEKNAKTPWHFMLEWGLGDGVGGLLSLVLH